MNKHLTTDTGDANGLQRAMRPTGFFNIKKMATHFCSAQCIMDNTGSLKTLCHLTHDYQFLRHFPPILDHLHSKFSGQINLTPH